MKKLSTGQDSTLGNWRRLSRLAFGDESAPVRFFDDKIKDQGENEEVLTDEGQLLNLLIQMHITEEMENGETG